MKPWQRLLMYLIVLVVCLLAWTAVLYGIYTIGSALVEVQWTWPLGRLIVAMSLLCVCLFLVYEQYTELAAISRERTVLEQKRRSWRRSPDDGIAPASFDKTGNPPAPERGAGSEFNSAPARLVYAFHVSSEYDDEQWMFEQIALHNAAMSALDMPFVVHQRQRDDAGLEKRN
jgi:hypothetical protein